MFRQKNKRSYKINKGENRLAEKFFLNEYNMLSILTKFA